MTEEGFAPHLDLIHDYLQQEFPHRVVEMRVGLPAVGGWQTYAVMFDGAEEHRCSVTYEFFTDTDTDAIPKKCRDYGLTNALRTAGREQVWVKRKGIEFSP